MNILITGGSGLIGSSLAKEFVSLGIKVSILTRDVSNKINNEKLIEFITNLNDLSSYYDIIINLAGEPLNKKRWNNKVKKQIYDSRINTTQQVIKFIAHSSVKPKLLISGSAIGYYGEHSDKIFFEDSPPANFGFTHELCKDWEQAALQTAEFGVRVCLLRTGIVLSANGGALKEMITPFKFGVGAKLGDGQQWMSWIHIEDVVNAVGFLIDKTNLEGTFNLTAPLPVTNNEFSMQLASTLKRPCLLRLPSGVVKIIFGEMGEKLLLKGQKVIPNKLLGCGYKFKFENITAALENLIFPSIAP